MERMLQNVLAMEMKKQQNTDIMIKFNSPNNITSLILLWFVKQLQS